MDEFNPYASPATSSDVMQVPRTSGYRLYLVLNLLYAGLLGVCLLVLLVGGSIRLAVPDMLVVGIFLAPLLSCWMVVANYAQAFRYWRFAQALIAGVLLLFCLDDLGRGALVGIGLFMTLVNALSLITSSHFYLLKQAAVEPAGSVQNG
jgi:hypothetical protein